MWCHHCKLTYVLYNPVNKTDEPQQLLKGSLLKQYSVTEIQHILLSVRFFSLTIYKISKWILCLKSFFYISFHYYNFWFGVDFAEGLETPILRMSESLFPHSPYSNHFVIDLSCQCNIQLVCYNVASVSVPFIWNFIKRCNDGGKKWCFPQWIKSPIGIHFDMTWQSI